MCARLGQLSWFWADTGYSDKLVPEPFQRILGKARTHHGTEAKLAGEPRDERNPRRAAGQQSPRLAAETSGKLRPRAALATVRPHVHAPAGAAGYMISYELS